MNRWLVIIVISIWVSNIVINAIAVNIPAVVNALAAVWFYLIWVNNQIKKKI